MSLTMFLEFVRDKCKKCFKKSNRKVDIQLKQSFIFKQQTSKQKLKQPQFSLPIPQLKTIKKQPNNVNTAQLPNQQQFYTIQSNLNSIQNQNYNRRSFKIMYSLDKKAKKSVNLTKKVSMKFESQQSIQTQKIILDLQIDKLKAWLLAQYGRPNSVTFRISHAVKLRMQGKSMPTFLIHKLQDFRILYLGQSNGKGYSFVSNNNMMSATYLLDDSQSSIKNKQVPIITHYFIQCSTVQLTQILSIFNSPKSLYYLHSFTQIKNVQYQGLGLDFPLFEVMQKKNKDLKLNKYLHIARQIVEIKFQQSELPQFVQTMYSLDEDEYSFKRVILITVGHKGMIQLYCESNQQIKGNQSLYFKDKFEAIKKLFIDIKILKKD